ncbi:MAG TPA: hypothetical protein VGL45_20970 [Bradyrhizobium sp.]
MRIVGDADTARFGNSLEPRRDVDAIAKDIVVVDDDVADMHPDAKFDPELGRHAGVLARHFLLDNDRATRGIDHAGELGQHAVSGVLDDAAAMAGDRRVHQRLSECLQLGNRAFLVAAHQPAIAGNVRRQHGRQSPFHALAGQKTPLGLGNLLPSEHRREHLR